MSQYRIGVTVGWNQDFFLFFAGLDFLERRQSKAHKDFAKITLDYFLAPSNCARKIYSAVGSGGY